MADNTTLDVGTGGDVIATDDCAGVKYQQVKLVNGTLDSTQVISSGNGTNTAALRVTIASDSTGVIGVTDNAGSLTVDNGGTFAVQDSQVLVDNAGFTDGTSKVFPVGYIFDDVAGTALTENDVGAPRINSNRATVGVIEDGATRARYATVTASNALKVDASGVAVPITDNSGSLTVDNAGTFSVQDTDKVTDNAAFTDGTTKLFMAGYILDDTAGTALTENDAAAPRISTNRATVGVIEDGATRARYATVTASNALKVDNSAVTQPVSFTDQSVNVHQVNGTTVDTNSGTKSAGTQRVVIATDQPQLTNALLVQNTPQTTGGLTIGAASNAKLISAASTNSTSVKGSAGQVYGWYMSNANASSATFVKLYNKATAPTVGSDTPVMTLMIPAGSAANTEFSQGIAFGTGIGLAITGAVGDADTTAVAANDVVVNLLYK